MFSVEMHGICKRFGKVEANAEAEFKVAEGEIHALVGENGAGKSTLMRILYGIYQPDSGEICINGKSEVISSPSRAISLGIGMVHQHFMLVPPLTVAENIILGNEPKKKGVVLDIRKAADAIRELSESCGLPVDPELRVDSLSVGLQQRVEILKLLYRKARILLLDEPTPVLTPQETDDLFRTLRRLRDSGMTIILITHKLTEVLSISNSVTVMRRGKTVGTIPTSTATKSGLARMMVGKDIETQVRKQDVATTGNVLEVERLSVLNDRKLPAVQDVSFTVAGGEIVGIAGVEGNGQSELVHAITGLRKAVTGKVFIDGKDFTNRHPGSHVAHIPEDRLKRGMVLPFTLRENVLLGRQREAEFSNRWKVRRHPLAEATRSIIERFDIRPADPSQRGRQLSGGNQQKLVVGRELMKNSHLIVASQPTRGLDIGAIEFIHTTLTAERNGGKGVLLVSSDLEELLLLCDRIAVMYEGKIVAMLPAAGTTEHELGLYMTGAKTAADRKAGT
jgi:general nucleoside transport system ATP-binding protein